MHHSLQVPLVLLCIYGTVWFSRQFSLMSAPPSGIGLLFCLHPKVSLFYLLSQQKIVVACYSELTSLTEGGECPLLFWLRCKQGLCLLCWSHCGAFFFSFFYIIISFANRESLTSSCQFGCLLFLSVVRLLYDLSYYGK